MVDTKFTALVELAATPTTGDVIAIIDDPGGSPISKKITVDNFLNFVAADTLTFTNKSYDLGGTGNVLTGSAGLQVDFRIVLPGHSLGRSEQNQRADNISGLQSN